MIKQHNQCYLHPESEPDQVHQNISQQPVLPQHNFFYLHLGV